MGSNPMAPFYFLEIKGMTESSSVQWVEHANLLSRMAFFNAMTGSALCVDACAGFASASGDGQEQGFQHCELLAPKIRGRFGRNNGVAYLCKQRHQLRKPTRNRFGLHHLIRSTLKPFRRDYVDIWKS